MNRVVDIRKDLEAVGIRPSVQRVAILNYLRKNPIHPTAETVYESLRCELGSLSLTTVHSTLKLLSDFGLAQMLTIDDKTRCFDGDCKAHSHFLCKTCGKIFDIPLPDKSLLSIGGVENFLIQDVQLYIKGVCNCCNKKH